MSFKVSAVFTAHFHLLHYHCGIPIHFSRKQNTRERKWILFFSILHLDLIDDSLTTVWEEWRWFSGILLCDDWIENDVNNFKWCKLMHSTWLWIDYYTTINIEMETSVFFNNFESSTMFMKTLRRLLTSYFFPLHWSNFQKDLQAFRNLIKSLSYSRSVWKTTEGEDIAFCIYNITLSCTKEVCNLSTP